MSFLVAIDGPAGSGKGTIAELLSEKLNFIHIDTGAMYRCITLYVLNNNIDKDNKTEIIKALDKIEVDQILKDGKKVFLLNGEDVTDFIRTERVNKIISDISSIHEVREKLLVLQRNIAKGKNVIMEGRDIGTTVFPNADVKIYLDADLDVRVERRYKEFIEKGIETTLEEVKKTIIQRDYKDIHREYGALKKAEDAIEVDSTKMSIDEVVNKVIEIIKTKQEDVKWLKRKILKAILGFLVMIVYKVKKVGEKNVPKER